MLPTTAAPTLGADLDIAVVRRVLFETGKDSTASPRIAATAARVAPDPVTDLRRVTR